MAGTGREPFDKYGKVNLSMCFRKVENIVYCESIGSSGLLDLYLPEGKACKALLIYFHGGGLEEGDKTDDENMLCAMAASGLAVVSANYRMYPAAKYPEFLEDAALAAAWSMKHVPEYIHFEAVWIGGISAGAYLAMMLHFQPLFLARHGIDEKKVKGYIFDAGQPTVHFRVLKERGMDPGAVCVDEAAPIFYLQGDVSVEPDQRFLIMVADCDIAGRREQNELLVRTMETHHYEKNQIDYRIIEGYEHAAYVKIKDENGNYPYADEMAKYIFQNTTRS